MASSRSMFAELIGAFALTFAGGAAIIVTSGGNLLAIAMAHGLILSVMVSATMHLSGGQFNPAVSIALGIIRKQSWSQTGVFVVAQLAGAVVAAWLLQTLLGSGFDTEAVKLGATLGSMSSGEARNIAAVLGLELIATFFLMFVIMGTAVDRRSVGTTAAVNGFAIGMTLAANILAIGPATGASLNPSRSFGPALIGAHWDIHWVYWLAPIIGATLAAVVYQAAFNPPRMQPD